MLKVILNIYRYYIGYTNGGVSCKKYSGIKPHLDKNILKSHT